MIITFRRLKSLTIFVLSSEIQHFRQYQNLMLSAENYGQALDVYKPGMGVQSTHISKSSVKFQKYEILLLI